MLCVYLDFSVNNHSKTSGAGNNCGIVSRSGIHLNRPYSYSQYWKGTSLQWRLMRGNIFKKYLHLKRFPRISLHCKLVPVQYREYEYGLFDQRHVTKNQPITELVLLRRKPRFITILLTFRAFRFCDSLKSFVPSPYQNSSVT